MAKRFDLKERFTLLNNLFGHAPFDHIIKAHLLRKYLAVKHDILAHPGDDRADEMIILSDVLWLPDARANVVEIMGGPTSGLWTKGSATVPGRNLPPRTIGAPRTRPKASNTAWTDRFATRSCLASSAIVHGFSWRTIPSLTGFSHFSWATALTLSRTP